MMNDWLKESQMMMQQWAAAQQQMLKNWSEMAQTSASTPGAASTGPLLQNMNALWQEMTLQGIRAWTGDADSTARSVAEKMYDSQNAMMRLIQMAMRVWTTLRPVLEKGEDWEATLKQQIDLVRDDLTQSAVEGLKGMKDMTQLWQTYSTQWQTFVTPWMSTMQGTPRVGDELTALTQMTGLYWDSFEETFGKMLQAPGMGYTREMDDKNRLSFAAWLDFQQAGYEYELVLGNAWVKAFEQLIREMVALTRKGEEIQNVRDFLNRWSTTADEVFKEVFRTQEYVEAQGRMINTMMAYRRRQRDVNEVVLRMYDLPTRSEIDEAHRRIYELRKEVKQLKKQIKQLGDGLPKASGDEK